MFALNPTLYISYFTQAGRNIRTANGREDTTEFSCGHRQNLVGAAVEGGQCLSLYLWRRNIFLAAELSWGKGKQ